MAVTEMAAAAAPARELRVLGRRVPVVLPSLHDPRLRVAAVIVSIHVLGQGPLHFDVSIAQILSSMTVCAAIEVGVELVRRKALVWPASALLTGSGVALLLRIPGTQHGDWFSRRGIHIFAATAALSLVSKYVLRVRDHQLFNPSNIGLVGCFLLLGPDRVDPQDLWWGPTNPGLVLAVVLIVVGGLSITRRLALLGMAAAFWLTFAAGVAVNDATGHCMSARWSFQPVCGAHHFTTVALSPEVLIFLFFMITDPRSTPRGRVARAAFGAAVGAVAGMLVAFQTTEFATKVAILGALVIVCAARPLLERACPEPGAEDDGLLPWLTPRAGGLLRRAGRAGVLVVLPFTAYLVWVVGLNERFGDGQATAEVAPAAARPSGAQVFLPPIEVAPGADRIASGFDHAAAQAAAFDLVEDLQIEVRAVQQRDQASATTSSAGARLDEVVALIDAAIAGRDATLSTYRFSQLRAVPFRDSPQAAPQLRFEAIATVLPLRADGTLGPATSVDASVVINLAQGSDGRYVITSAT
jgi:hypothetical protein